MDLSTPTQQSGTHTDQFVIFETLFGNNMLVKANPPTYTILAVTAGYEVTTGKAKEQLIGNGVFEVFPPNPNDPSDTGEKDLRASFEQAIAFRKPHFLPVQRYDLPADKVNYVEKYWKAGNAPVLNDRGEVAYIIHTVEDITDQIKVQQQEEKIKGMEQVNNLFMQAPFAIHIFTGPDFIIELANAPTLEMWGREGDVIGKPFFEVVPEVEEQGYGALMNEVMETGQARFFYETAINLNRPGKDKAGYYNFVFQPYYKEGSKKAESVLIIAHEVTLQVIARQKIEESEQKYQRLFASMNQAFCVLEMIFEGDKPVDYRFEEINPVFEEQTGLKNAIGKTIRELVPNLEAHWFELYGKVARTGEPVRLTEGSNAMSRWFDVYAFKVGDDTSRKVAVLFSDITERRKAEEAVRKSEQNLRRLILQAPVAMCILREPQSIVEIANERMFEIWGKKAGEVMHKPLFEGLPEAKEQGFEDLLYHVYTTGETFKAFERPANLPRNGKIETVYLNFVYEPFYGADGKISGIIAVAIDVTEQVLARQKIEEVVAERTKELAEANKELAEAFEALNTINIELKRSNAHLEEFAHAASHDLKEPVRKIRTFINLLKAQLNNRLKEGEERSFNRIESATERMGNLIDDLLLYSHVNERPHETEAVDLNEKIKRVLEDLELDIEEKKAIVHVGELPIVQGYSRQLQQLFQNLVSNALKYSKAGIAPEIHIRAKEVLEKGQTCHSISVQDHGIGFEQHFEEKIFQMFSRLHGKSEYSGTGVGLSIVKKVIENHNGFIRVESVPGEGANFIVYLPVQ